ncbi:MAG: M23 family metallopeptidase [Anaerolineae bacterium]|nr:M23 family metallopeptidase [Anaerolineae bacterium]
MSNEWLTRLQAGFDALGQLVAEMQAVLAGAGEINTDDDAWMFPVNDPAGWYCAVWHDLTGARNGGYRHTGIDLNLDRRPWGDVERGFPIYALASGQVVAATSSSGWLGVVQVMHQHLGQPLWARYAHLDATRLMVNAGGTVIAGQLLGYIGNWTGGDGGDHLHLDMALTPFYWAAWLAAADEWIDPVGVLRAHLEPEIVDALLARNG